MSTLLFSIELQTWTRRYILYVNSIILCIGLFGNILNILIFTKLKLFRRNRCAFYFIIESIVDIYLLLNIVLPILYQAIYRVDPEDESLIWCKLKTTFSQSFRLLIGSIVCYEALDQFFSTNHQHHLRQLINLKLARILIISTTIICTLQTIPYIIFFDIVPPFGCIIVNEILVNYYSYVYYVFLNGLLPIFIACLFSILAYRNVRRLVRRQIPIERRRLDRQMTAMVFVRVIAFVTFSLPYTIFRIYLLNTNDSTIDSFHQAVYHLVLVLVTSILLWNYSLNFYLFLLTSSRFRRQIKHFLIKRCWQSIKRYCRCDLNTVHPMDNRSDSTDM